ncbi:tRNA (adenine(58)-N(1))-methyltransferase non-catalytic subunit TRM6 [Mactra antiquata]
MTSTDNLVKDGDRVMLKKGDNLRVFQVHKGREIFLEKMKFKLDGIIGETYGSLFEVKDGEMVKIVRQIENETSTDDKGIDTEKDNRHLLDQDSNQKLKQEEIEQMKKDGISGAHLIDQLIENSATFQSKTEFSQAKWVKKKKKKHLNQFTVLRPSTRLLCEMHWSKGPSRICNLRIDSLSQMLTMGNIRAGSTVMVVESCLGLVTGAVLERLGGFGKVISFYHGDSPMKCNLDNYDFSKEIMDTLYNYPLELVNSLKHKTELRVNDDVSMETADLTDESKCIKVEQDKDKSDNIVPSVENVIKDSNVVIDTKADVEMESESKNESESKTETRTESDLAEGEGQLKVADRSVEKTDNREGDCEQKTGGKRRGKKWNKRDNKVKKTKERAEAKILRAKEIVDARRIIQEKNVDCLIVATKFHPTPIVLALVDYVNPSRQIVVYSQFKEALEDCYVYLREHKGLVNYRLTETWLREYQVLPNRTHPVIQMSGTGGYVLTATTVVKSPN